MHSALLLSHPIAGVVLLCPERADGATALAKAALPAPTAPTAAAGGAALRDDDDTVAVRDVNSAPAEGPWQSVSVAITAGNTGLSSSSSSTEQSLRSPTCLVPVHEDAAAALASTNSLCPVVAFASFAGQLGFKAALHIAVFGGEGGSLRA